MTQFPALRAVLSVAAKFAVLGSLALSVSSLWAQSGPNAAINAKPAPDEAIPPAPIVAGLEAASLPPKPSWKEERLARAEELYQAGYRLYQTGEKEAARQQFDQAIDLVLNSGTEPSNRSAFDKRFDELVQKIYRIDVDMARADKPAPSQPAYDKAPIDDILSLTFPVDPKMKLKVREEVGATVSQLPLEASDAVLSFINYFSGERGRRTLVGGLKRSGRYKPMIARILDEEGIPQEFIFLAQAESGFLPRAMSYMAAGGMWQFIRETGAKYGLKADAWVDERFDPEMATRAAARHLRDLYHEFGDWYLAIAAYNCGQGNVEKAVIKTGYADVWELRSRGTLPLETSNYVPIILAMTIMAKNPANYDILGIETDEPVVYDNLEMTALTSLALIADIIGRPVAELKELNPALLRDFAPAGYKLHIPRGSGPALMAGLDLVPGDRRASWRAHRAESGETLATLATRYRTTIASLQTANQLDGTELTPGALLVVPAAPAPIVAPRPVRAPYRPTVNARGPAGARAGTAPAARQPAPKAPARTATASKSAVPHKAPSKPAAAHRGPRG